MPEFVGRSLPRLEDRRFLTGQGRFVDDIRLPGELHAAFVRSPHAHAHIRSIDTSGAAVLSGVRGVFTGEDWLADGMGEGPILDPMDARDGTPMKLARRPILTSDAVRHVGDTVAMIVADDARLAVQAAEAVMVDYEERPAVVDARDALMPDAPLVHTGLGTNLSFDWEIGDEDAVAQALRSAAQVTTLELVNNRLCAAPLEPRAVLGSYAPGDDRYTLWTTTQMPHLVRRWLSRDALRVPEHRIRVVAPDVGGGFGQKGYLYAEEAAVLWASRRLGRPVRWTATRAEAFQVDVQARDHVTRAQLALDADGRIVALAVETDAGLGAYHVPFGCLSPTTYYGPNLCGVYKVPALHAHDARRRLSRRRPRRSQLCHRTPAGRGGARGRARSCRAAPAQSDNARRSAL